jgi:hypothetical protein
MVIILIRRCVKPGKEEAFLADYRNNRPNHAGFIRECLTKLSSSETIPEYMRSLPIDEWKCGECVTYINVALWKDVESFMNNFEGKTAPSPDFECQDRLRIAFEVVESSFSVPGKELG